MKILIVSSKFPYPAKDGGALAIKNMCEQLAKRGHKIKFLAVETDKHPVTEVPVIENIDFETVYVNTNLKLIQLILNLLFSTLPYIAVRFFSAALEAKVTEALKKETYDWVLLEGLYVAYLIEVIKRVWKGKIIVRAHNVEHKIWERKLAHEKNLFKKFYLKSMVKRLQKYEIKKLSETDWILTITPEDSEIIKELGINTETYVVPFGIDTENYQAADLNDTNLEFIGALDWMPNEEGLLWFLDNVWSTLKNTHLKFFVAGRNATQALSEKLKGIPSVEFLGEVDDAQKFILSHGVFIVPLLTGSGMRVKIIEAMALGRLVISTSIGIEGIDAVPGEHFVLADSPEEWITAIKNITSHQELARNIALKGKNFVEKHFSNEIIYEQLDLKLQKITKPSSK